MQYIKLHKSGCVPYLALGAHCPPLTPLKFAKSKFKYTEAKPRCSGLLENQCAMLERVRYTLGKGLFINEIILFSGCINPPHVSCDKIDFATKQRILGF